MRILALIPARMGSTRFPGKPLKKILDKPMIGHVYDNVKKSKIVSDVFVATCDNQIAEYISSISGKFIMTGSHHERATDRCAEALLLLKKQFSLEYDLVVMVQGDEPMICPEMINQAVQPILTDSSVCVTNLMSDICSDEEFYDKNCIKVVYDSNHDAVYFSREPIPYSKSQIIGYKQVCVMGFTTEALLKYSELNPGNLEAKESVDMLRFIENGIKIRMILTDYRTKSVDTQTDLESVTKMISLAI